MLDDTKCLVAFATDDDEYIILPKGGYILYSLCLSLYSSLSYTLFIFLIVHYFYFLLEGSPFLGGHPMESKEVEGRRANIIHISAVFQFFHYSILHSYLFFLPNPVIHFFMKRQEKKKKKNFIVKSHIWTWYIYLHSQTHTQIHAGVNELNIYVWVCMCLCVCVNIYVNIWHAFTHTYHMYTCAKHAYTWHIQKFVKY